MNSLSTTSSANSVKSLTIREEKTLKIEEKCTMRRQFQRYGIRRYLYTVAGLLLLFLIYRWLTKKPELPDNYKMGYRGEVIATRGEPAPTGNTVKLSVYMESQCPDTSRFVHKQLMKAWEKLGSSGRVDITLIPFGKARCVEKGDDFECSCQHGANECALNQLMNCVIDRVGFPDKYVPVVNCIQGERTLEGAIGKCLAGKNVTDEEQMRTCANGPRGRRLLALAGAQTVALKPSLNFVPWITINGERSSDALYDLTENLCKKLQPAPEGCTEYKL